MAIRLEYFCTNNQAEYEALLFDLEILESMDVKHVEDFVDSLLVVHQVSREYECLDGSLNAYLDKCLSIITRFNEFSIHHIYRHENSKANDLAQQAYVIMLVIRISASLENRCACMCKICLCLFWAQRPV
jgi:ribonuclease HI